MTRRKWLILFLLAFAAWILVRLVLFQFPEELLFRGLLRRAHLQQHALVVGVDALIQLSPG